MKKTFDDLSNDEKKEYYFLRAMSIDIPYTIALVPFLVILLITSSKFVGIGSLIILGIIGIGYYIDSKKHDKIYGLN